MPLFTIFPTQLCLAVVKHNPHYFPLWILLVAGFSLSQGFLGPHIAQHELNKPWSRSHQGPMSFRFHPPFHIPDEWWTSSLCLLPSLPDETSWQSQHTPSSPQFSEVKQPKPWVLSLPFVHLPKILQVLAVPEHEVPIQPSGQGYQPDQMSRVYFQWVL